MIKKKPAANLDSRMDATFPPAQRFRNRRTKASPNRSRVDVAPYDLQAQLVFRRMLDRIEAVGLEPQ